jgi:hypothetical protein
MAEGAGVFTRPGSQSEELKVNISGRLSPEKRTFERRYRGALWAAARHHTSLFETKAKGIKQLARLEAAIAEARAAR